MSAPLSLDEIGLMQGTDKASTGHNYLTFLEPYFAPLRDQPLRVLEIGVHRGASLRTWAEYFPNAKIVGVDILPWCKRYEADRVVVELADQSNIEHLTPIAVEHGPFDIIVEDGSHMWDHQVTTLRTLFPFLKSGGFYVAEDLQTNFGSMAAQYRGVASASCVDFLKRWMDVFVAGDQIDPREIEDSFLRTYGRALEFMTFNRHACLLKKKSQAPDWRLSPGPALAEVTPATGLRPVLVLAHVGLRGDVYGPKGHVDLGDDRLTIQGFALDSELGVLEYKVRSPDLSWSDWISEGQFAGTRGRAIPLTGFIVRVKESARHALTLRAHGRFVGLAEPIAVGDGQDCVAPLGQDLRGVQVELLLTN